MLEICRKVPKSTIVRFSYERYSSHEGFRGLGSGWDTLDEREPKLVLEMISQSW